MSLARGTRIGPFEILAPIGAGGMGEVYRAHDTRLKRDVALKVLPAEFAGDPERAARFTREAEVLASLNHPNIAAIYGVEDRALAMELVEGESPKGPMPFEEAWKVASQIADALEYAHEKGVVHRDLKPANVKVTHDGVVKLLDFGLAKAFQEGPSAASGDPANSPTLTMGATVAGTIMGTAAYMAPEQAKGKKVDKRADIWSFGVVLYELVTGERLFKGEDAMETLAHVVTAKPDLSTIPAQARGLLDACLQKDPKHRLRDIGDAKRLLIGETVVSAKIAPVVSSSPWLSRAGWLVAGVALLSLVALYYVHGRENPPVPAQVMRFEIPAPDKIMPTRGGILSPDGSKFAFPAVGPNGRQIWLRSIDSLEARPIAGTEGTPGTRPFWSPDSRFLAFESGGKLKKVDIAGGPVQTLCDLNGVLLGGVWTRDGVLLVGSAIGPIVRVSAGGGAPVPITKSAENESGHQFPSLLPDQRHFVYRRGNLEGTILIGSIDQKPEEQSQKTITTSEAGAIYSPNPSDPSHGQLLTLRSGTLLTQPFDAVKQELTGEPVAIAEQVGQYNTDVMASVSENGTLLYRAENLDSLRLAWFDRQGKSLGSVGETSRISRIALSPDDTRVAVGHSTQHYISVMELARGIDTRITFGNDDRYPVWSHDGTRIAYATKGGIFQKAANGLGTPELLLPSTEDLVVSDWSSDARYLLFWGVGGAKGSQLSASSLDRSQKTFPVASAMGVNIGGRFSPDARWIAYRSNEAGSFEIYVSGFNAAPGNNGKWQVSQTGATMGGTPEWRRDGKELYYLSSDRYLMAVDVSTHSTFQPGAIHRLFPLPLGGSTFDADSEGKRFLIPVPTNSASVATFTIVLNWQTGLKQ